MRRVLLLLAFGCVLFLLSGGPSAAAETRQQEYSAIDRVTPLRWANWLIFIAGLGYLIYRYAPPFFNARSTSIQKAIQDATGLKLQGDFRRAEADKKLATLPAEIAKIRRQHDESMAREHDCIIRETEDEIRRIHHNVTTEISALRMEGVRRIRRQTAESAVELAERRLRERLAKENVNFVPEFVRTVERDGTPGAAR